MSLAISAKDIRELRERTGIGMGKCKEALVKAGGDIELAITNLRKAGMASASKKEGRETKEGAIAWAENDRRFALVEINAETDFVARNEVFKDFLKEMSNELLKGSATNLASFLAQPFSADPSISIDEYRATIVQKIGENIQIRRVTFVEKSASTSVGIYSHMGGRILTLVTLTAAKQEALAKDIAMHIAAESPEFLDFDSIPGAIRAKEKEIAKEQVKGKPDHIVDKIVEGKLRAFYERTCLMQQAFIKDSSFRVKDIIDQKAKEISTAITVRTFLLWRLGEKS